MKTTLQPTFPKLQNSYLNQLLPQLISRYSVVQLFYTPHFRNINACLFIHLKSKEEATRLQNQKWVKKARVSHNLNVFIFYSFQLQMLYNSGNPFIAAYCNASTLLYTNPEANTALETDHQWKHFKKKLDHYRESFYHDHELLRAQIRPFITADCDTAVLLVYENLLAFDLEYLEALYLGATASLKPLHERITTLIPYVPQIQQYFVKDKTKGYYLTTLIAKAKEASLDREWYFASENYEAFRLAEAGLFALIEQRFKALKQIIKSKKKQPLPATPGSGSVKSSPLPEKALAILQNTNHLEEVYLFHHARYGEVQTFYLLLIGARMGNTFLKDLSAQLKAVSGTGREFVLIGHTRLWIQEWQYSYQSFFYKIINNENRVVASSPYHPAPHWEVPYTTEYPELEHYYERTEEVYDQFLFLVDCDKLNYQGVAGLFSLFFQCFCRTYLYATLSYYPNCLSSNTLWQLCIYANPNLKHYEFLFTEMDTNFFNSLDHHRTIQTTNSYLVSEKRKQMLKITETLINELHKAMKNHKPTK